MSEDIFIPLWEYLHKKLPNALYGPAHCVLADGNLDDMFIHYTVKDINDILSGKIIDGIDYIKEGHSKTELIATAVILDMLLMYPEKYREYAFYGWGE